MKVDVNWTSHPHVYIQMNKQELTRVLHGKTKSLTASMIINDGGHHLTVTIIAPEEESSGD